MIRDGSRRETFAVAVGALIAVVFAIFGPVQAIPPATGADGGPAGLTVGRLVPGDGVDFQIRNRGSNLCLAARVGSGERPVVQSTCDGSVWQHWELVIVDRLVPLYRLRSVRLGLCLAVRSGGEIGAVVTGCDYAVGDHQTDQHWRLGDEPKGARIENVSLHQCLAAHGLGGSPAIGAKCRAGDPGQHWYQEPV